MQALVAETVLTGIKSLSTTAKKDLENEAGKIKALFTSILRIPIKVIATFILSPIMLVIILINVRKNDKISMIRFYMIIIGFVIAIIVSYLAGTFLGGLAGAIFIASHIGYITAIGFIIGSSLSVFITVAFQIIIFNLTTTLFLKISQKETIKYLEEMLDINPTNYNELKKSN